MNINEKITLKGFSINPMLAMKTNYETIEMNFYFVGNQIRTEYDVISNDGRIRIDKFIIGGYFTFRGIDKLIGGFINKIQAINGRKILLIIKDPKCIDIYFYKLFRTNEKVVREFYKK